MIGIKCYTIIIFVDTTKYYSTLIEINLKLMDNVKTHYFPEMLKRNISFIK